MGLETKDRTIALIGNPGVGKTQLIQQYIYDAYSPTYVISFGAEAHDKTIVFRTEKQQVHMLIWDTTGHSVEHGVKYAYKKSGKNLDGAIIVADITRVETVQDVTKWLEAFLILIFGKGAMGSERVQKLVKQFPVMVFLNKYDVHEYKNFIKYFDLGDLKFMKYLDNLKASFDTWYGKDEIEIKYAELLSSFEAMTYEKKFDEHMETVEKMKEELEKYGIPVIYTSAKNDCMYEKATLGGYKDTKLDNAFIKYASMFLK